MKDNGEYAARKKVLDELFQDFNRSRGQVYKMNFIIGILFGLGSVLGGTVVLAILIWFFSILGQFIPGIGDVFKGISQLLKIAE